MILWSNGTTTRPGITLAGGTYERTEWTADHKSRVLVKRRWVEIWNGECVELVLKHESGFTHAEVDATPDVVALAEAWRADEAYRDEQRREAIRDCSSKLGELALATSGWDRGMIVLRVTPNQEIEGQDAARSLRSDPSNLCRVPRDLVKATGVAPGDKPAWAPPVTVLSNKNRPLAYLAMRRMATEPELLARVEAHGRIVLEAGGKMPMDWRKKNNVLFGLEPRR